MQPNSTKRQLESLVSNDGQSFLGKVAARHTASPISSIVRLHELMQIAYGYLMDGAKSIAVKIMAIRPHMHKHIDMMLLGSKS